MTQPRNIPTPGSPDAPLPVRLRYFLAVAVWAITLGLALYFFAAARILLLGLLAAGCMAATLYPLLPYVPGSRWARAAIIGIAPPAILAGLMALTVWLLAGPIRASLAHWPQLRRNVNALLAGWSVALGLDEPVTLGSLLEQAGTLLTGAGGQQILRTTTQVASGLLIALAFIFFGSIYLLGEKPDRLLAPLLRAVPANRRSQVRAAFADLIPRLRWWLLGTLISMAVVGAASGIGYTIVGLEAAFPLALLAGLSEIVPTLGPAATFLLALMFATAQGAGTMIGVAVVHIVIQLLESHILLPLIMKGAVHIPPVVTLFSVVLWGQIFGVAGLLLALPIDLVIWTFADHFLPGSSPPASPSSPEPAPP